MKLFQGIKVSAKVVVLGISGLALALAGTVYYAYSSVAKEVPDITKVSDYRPKTVTQVISMENGQAKLMAEFYKERRYLTPYDQIPEKLVQAFLSAEDSTFFEHQGINFMAITRAAIANFLAGQVVQGGSTITQQIAKSLYLSPDRNIIRKLKELFLAFQLEKHLSKEEILYLYLNQIYLGSGAYGVQAAAKTYFQKDLKKITLAEMALIAGLPTAPGKYSPLLNPKKAKERQLYVLKRMRENGFISENEHQQAQKEKSKIYVDDGTQQRLAPHFVEHIRRYIAQKHGDKALYEEGLTVVVPASIRFYEFATQALEEGLEEIDQKKGFRGPVKNLPQAEWDQFRADATKKITAEFFPYRYLTPGGELDLETAMKDYDPTFEKSLKGKKVQALITGFSPDGSKALATIGVQSLVLPFDGMAWAKPVDSKKEPKTATEVLKVGDLVWVKPYQFGKEGIQAKLIQIPEIQGALYSVDIATGQILSMVGGYDFGQSEFNRAVQARRQMGSTFKPVIYAAALERGYTPASIIVDSPIVFEDAENGVWKPENYEEKFYGDTTFRAALINSRNIPTVKIVQDIRVQSVIDLAKRLGLDGPFNNDLSISLGSATTTVQDLVHAFTVFPMQGRPFRAVLFEKVLDRDGRTLETSKDLPSDQADLNENVDTAKAPYAPVVPGIRLDPRVSYVMTHLMKEVVQYGTAGRANSIGRPVAGKTGTTQDFHDGWFIGFSPRIVTGVWVGYDDQRSMGYGETGANTALPIWIRYMQKALELYPADEFVPPEGVVSVSIDSKTGKRSDGARAIKEWFIAGTEPGAAPAYKEPPAPGTESNTLDEVDDENLREDN